MRRTLLVLLSLLSLLGTPRIFADAPQGYYRYPAIHGDTLVFAAEGDLWRVGAEGGVARRLTTHPGEERDPALSPDGTTLAFTATYEGPRELYTMPLEGGLPTRRTYDGWGVGAVGWVTDDRILFSTRRYSTLPDAQLVSLELTARRRTVLPLSQAADGCYAGGTLFFTRLPKQWSQTKRYKGGTAQNLWSFGEGAGEAVPLTADFPGTSRTPMCWRDRIYFVSDRDDTLNLWSMHHDGGDLQQHTSHRGWDVKSPDLSGGRIVYQLGADLRVYDIDSGRDREIPIRLASDFDQMRERWVDEPMDYLTAVELSPDGDRIALTARGEVFVAPVEGGRRIHVTRQPDARYREARFLPDGKSLVALSDESGEVEWWQLPASGIGEKRQITTDGKVLRYEGVPSPDGKWLAHYDHDQELWLTRLDSGEFTRLDFSPLWDFDGPSWSPDSAWLAWARPGDNGLYRVFLYELAGKQRTAVTSDRFDSWSPVWHPGGEWLYFLSDREFRSLVGSPWGTRAPAPFFERQTRIYALPLTAGLRSPFQADDELRIERKADEDEGDAASDKKGKEKTVKKKGKEKKADDEEASDEEKPVRVRIDLDGIERRIVEIPIDRGNYSGLAANEEHLFWVARDTAGERTTHLMGVKIDNDDPKPVALVSGIRRYRSSADGKKLLVQIGKRLHVFDASASKPDLDDSVDLDSWAFSLDPREEWRQLFVESWRLERDYFYDPGMHGVDWDAMLQKYLPLVDRVTNRSELSDLQAQMAAELSALHIFVRGGDHRKGEDDFEPASLGAVLARDVPAGGYRVEHVYRGDPDYPDDLAPLARPGVEVVAGDVIESINGVPTLSVADAAALLRHQKGQQVRLRVRPGGAGEARDVIVEPISARGEADLRYTEWEYTRRMKVDEAGQGRIGYVHLRAMGRNDVAAFYRDFFPVFNRQGLIIDVRHNRGGNIDSWILEKLLRRAWFYWQPRVGQPYWNMQYAFRGHMVVLVDEWTASDGEAFAEGFRRLGLGQVIGKRTWGGEIWLTSSNVLVDRGIVTAAEFGVYGPEGEWLIEGHGVEPDLVVDNPPHATFNGEDAQLQAAVEHLERLIESDPRPVPAAPPYPDKSVQE